MSKSETVHIFWCDQDQEKEKLKILNNIKSECIVFCFSFVCFSCQDKDIFRKKNILLHKQFVIM